MTAGQRWAYFFRHAEQCWAPGLFEVTDGVSRWITACETLRKSRSKYGTGDAAIWPSLEFTTSLRPRCLVMEKRLAALESEVHVGARL